VVNFQIEVKHLVEVECIDAGDGRAQGIAHEIADVMILKECLILGKNWTLRRFLDIGLQSHQAAFAGLVEQVVQHFQVSI
jgi:hypothetical protein